MIYTRCRLQVKGQGFSKAAKGKRAKGLTALGHGSVCAEGSARMRSLPSGQHFTLHAFQSSEQRVGPDNT